jgi:hypothetical protein
MDSIDEAVSEVMRLGLTPLNIYNVAIWHGLTFKMFVGVLRERGVIDEASVQHIKRLSNRYKEVEI